MIKVYATVEVKNNLITTIPFKGVKVRVEFTGGNVMKNIPAKLYTNDPFTQKALDESDLNGRMFRLVQTVIEEGDKKPAAKQPPVNNPKPPVNTDTPEQAPEPPAEQDDQPKDEGEKGGDTDGKQDNKKLEFANLGEAITYIAAKYGEQVETENAARKFIEEKEGVKPIIHKG